MLTETEWRAMAWDWAGHMADELGTWSTMTYKRAPGAVFVYCGQSALCDTCGVRGPAWFVPLQDITVRGLEPVLVTLCPECFWADVRIDRGRR